MAAPPIAVFDLDGTLAETAGDLIGTLNVLLTREGLAELPLSQARELIGAGAKALIKRGFEAEGREISPAEHERLFDDFIAHYGEHLANSSHLFDGVVQALDRLEDSGFRLAVCTNKYEGQSVKLLGLLGIADRFAAICGRDTFPQSKPDPRHLTGTIERAGGDPARAVMVGDLAHRHRHRQGGGHPGGRRDVRLHRHPRLRTRARPGDRALRGVARGRHLFGARGLTGLRRATS